MDQYTQKEIEKIAWRILKDAGLTQPPIKPNDLIEHLRLNLDFYSLEDPGFLKSLQHKFNVKIQHLKNAVQKSKMIAAWLPDVSRIVIDGSLPEKKKIFPQFHEITHSILPWHKEFFLGDTAQTLDHEYQELLENEANYGASELMFCGPMFRAEITDLDPSMKTVQLLKKKYENSLVTTARKLIRSQPESICFVTVSSPPWFELDQNPGTLKSLEVSQLFEKQFSMKVKETLIGQINPQLIERRGGSVGEFIVIITDLNFDCYEFECETFFNTHEIITIGILRDKVNSSLIL